MDNNTLHNEAMDLAELAIIEKSRGNLVKSKELFENSFKLEKQAAEATLPTQESEPSRSVLFRSAASLAMNYGDYKEAEKMIFLGLAGTPPDSLAEELKDLYEQVNFERHMILKGIKLEANEVQLSLAGNAVGFGIASIQEIFKRVESLKKLAYRTIERKMGQPFREGGSIKKEIKDQFEPFISVPRAGSFAVTIKLGRPEQLTIPGFDSSVEILSEIVDGIDLINQNKENLLKQKIKDEAYFINFLALTKELAPDGEDVNLVGLTFIKDTKEVKLALTRKSKKISISPLNEEGKEDMKKDEHRAIEVIGTLSFADAEKDQIKLTSSGEKYTLNVPSGLMNDIVKPYWGETVKVIGKIEGKIIHLEEISRAEESK